MSEPDLFYYNPFIRSLQLLFVIPILGLARYIENTPATITSAAMLVYIPLTFSPVCTPIHLKTMFMEVIFLAMWVYLAFVAIPAEGCMVEKVIRSLCSYLVPLGVVAWGFEYYIRDQVKSAFDRLSRVVLSGEEENAYRGGPVRSYGINYGTYM